MFFLKAMKKSKVTSLKSRVWLGSQFSPRNPTFVYTILFSRSLTGNRERNSTGGSNSGPRDSEGQLEIAS